MNNNMEKEILDIYIDDIIPNRFQPRLSFDEKSLNELADSIKTHGIIQPLVVRKVGDKYEIIAGERRYKAAQIAGLSKVPAVVMKLDDNESAEVAVIENTQRRDLTALEEAESYKKLLDKGYLTQDQLASRMGKTQATISNKLRLLNLQTEVKDALLNEKISERHARSLLSLKDPVEQTSVLNKIIDNKLTVKQTDDLIKTMVGEQVDTLDLSENQTETVSPIPPISFNANTQVETPIPTASFINPANDFNTLSDDSKEPILENTFTPVSDVDVNKVREQAVDINPISDKKSVTDILGISTNANISVEEKPNEFSTARFINPSIEEGASNTNPIPFLSNQEISSNSEPTPIEPVINTPIINPSNEINNVVTEDITPPTPIQYSEPLLEPNITAAEPKTYTDSLVQEFRQTNGATGDSNVVAPGNLRGAINAIREVTKTIEKSNFKVDVEEFDFENLYQIIIKIDK